MRRIPVCEPLLGTGELENVHSCFRDNWISSRGAFIDEFECRFAAYCGCRFAVSTTSGTTALHLALAALELGPGDEVIVPCFTMAASVFAVLYTGATPVLVDSDPVTWTVDVSKIEEKVSPRTRAIMPVHIYGHPCNMDEILEMAARRELVVVEDAAEAHGAEYRGRRVGGIGDVGCFSFYANKIITTGEGGMLVTNDETIATRARVLKDMGFSRTTRFVHDEIGFNYRMTNLQAAIGLAQLENVERFVQMRRNNAYSYNALLRDVPTLQLPPEMPWVKSVYWMYGVLVQAGVRIGRDQLRVELEARGVETRSFFIGMHLQPVFRKAGLFQGERFPVAEDLGARGLYLPSSTGLSASEIEYVCDAVRDILAC